MNLTFKEEIPFGKAHLRSIRFRTYRKFVFALNNSHMTIMYFT